MGQERNNPVFHQKEHLGSDKTNTYQPVFRNKNMKQKKQRQAPREEWGQEEGNNGQNVGHQEGEEGST